MRHTSWPQHWPCWKENKRGLRILVEARPFLLPAATPLLMLLPFASFLPFTAFGNPFWLLRAAQRFLFEKPSYVPSSFWEAEALPSRCGQDPSLHWFSMSLFHPVLVTVFLPIVSACVLLLLALKTRRTFSGWSGFSGLSATPCLFRRWGEGDWGQLPGTGQGLPVVTVVEIRWEEAPVYSTCKFTKYLSKYVTGSRILKKEERTCNHLSAM